MDTLYLEFLTVPGDSGSVNITQPGQLCLTIFMKPKSQSWKKISWSMSARDLVKSLFFDTLVSEGYNSKSRFEDLEVDFENIQELRSLTHGEKKQLFSEFITFVLKKEKADHRVKQQLAREEFVGLLGECMRNGMSADVSFRQVASVFHNMEFWSCLDLEELDDIFQDFLDKYLRDHHNEIRERNHENKRELFRMLENSSACERIEPGVTKWGDIVDRFRNSQVFGKLDDLDKFEVFEDFMKETLEKDRDDQRRRENRKARQARERFMSLLESRKDLIENEIKWSEFVESIRGMDEYIDLVGTRHSSQPYDLFAEMRSTWKRERCTDDVAMVVATDDNVT